MDTTKQYQERQEGKQLQSRISSFTRDCRISTLLNKSGIKKSQGKSFVSRFTGISPGM